MKRTYIVREDEEGLVLSVKHGDIEVVLHRGLTMSQLVNLDKEKGYGITLGNFSI